MNPLPSAGGDPGCAKTSSGKRGHVLGEGRSTTSLRPCSCWGDRLGVVGGRGRWLEICAFTYPGLRSGSKAGGTVGWGRRRGLVNGVSGAVVYKWSRAQCKGVLWMGHRVEVSIVNRRWEWQRHRRTADTCHHVTNPRPHRGDANCTPTPAPASSS